MKEKEWTYHDTAVPALASGSSDAGGESRSRHVAAARSIASKRGLANDELAQVNAVRRDLEERRARVLSTRGSEKTSAVGVLRSALVVELDVVPVDHGADGAVDGEVASSGVALLEPGSDGGMCDDILPRRKLGAELLRERDEPVDCRCSSTVERVEVLVVDCD